MNYNKLFIYGTLTDPDIQRDILGRISQGVHNVLRGYKKSRVEIEGTEYPLIVPDKEKEVEGLVISVTNKELDKIDKYETTAYKREHAILKNGASAWVYVKR